MKFTVDRARWGYGSSGGSLLSKRGLMCCLGFICEERGMIANELQEQGMPANAIEAIIGEQRLRDLSHDPGFEDLIELIDPNDERYNGNAIISTPLARKAAEINDQYNYASREARETALIELFQDHGHELEFVGETKLDMHGRGPDHPHYGGPK